MSNTNTKYSKKELEDSIKRAFNEVTDYNLHYILVDGWTMRNSFLREGIYHGINNEFIEKRGEIKDSQYLGEKYFLTDKGIKYFFNK